MHEAISPTSSFSVLKLSKVHHQNIHARRGEKEIFELSRLNAIDLSKLAQLSGQIHGESRQNPSGMAGAGMGMGMGFAMASQMGQAFGQQQQQAPASAAGITGSNTSSNTTGACFLCSNQWATAVIPISTLKQMVSQNRYTRETLVWREITGRQPVRYQILAVFSAVCLLNTISVMNHMDEPTASANTFACKLWCQQNTSRNANSMVCDFCGAENRLLKVTTRLKRPIFMNTSGKRMIVQKS